MILSELEGYLTGVMVRPDLVMPHEWLPMVWGYGEPVFEDEAQADDMLGLIMALYTDIAHRLDDPETCIPLIEQDSDGSFLREFWAAGSSCQLAARNNQLQSVSPDEQPYDRSHPGSDGHRVSEQSVIARRVEQQVAVRLGSSQVGAV